MKSVLLSLLAVHVAVALPAARADVSLASIFTDHAVLQRGKPVPIWGTATPGEKVSVSYREAGASTTAATDGTWRLELPVQQLGQAAELIITGTNRIVLKDVVVGEVWICSGQSNMAFTVEKADNAAAEIATAGNPDIRFFQAALATPETPAANVSGTWVISSRETAGKFTAVGYFFARELHQVLGVPIGIINSSVGGTPIEAWMSAEALAAFPDAIAATLAEAKKGKKVRHAKNQPNLLYNGMIAPLMPYAIRGFLWYQGEGNAHTAERATAYGDLLNTLIAHWRQGFGQGDVPFYFVQLPNFKTRAPESGLWVLLRASQSQALALPHTRMAVTIDVGNPTDIHPNNKQPVGRRLALLALKEAYHQSVVATGPVLRDREIRGHRVRLEFDQTIVIKSDEPRGFEIAGHDGMFLPASSTSKGKSVWIENAAVQEPMFVRYAWANNPVACLFNEEGLPAAPFLLDLNTTASPPDTSP